MFNRAVKMTSVVRYCFLLISICLRSSSCSDAALKVTSLIEAVGKNISIQCSAELPQDGVYLYKQVGARIKEQEVFYYYKDGNIKPKSKWCRDKVKVNGKFPNFNVTISNVNATDTGFYWCEFNLEEKKTFGTVTWLRIEESETNNKETNKTTDEKVCTEDIHHHVKIFLIVCAVLVLLCISGFIFVILKVKGCFERKKWRPSNPPSDSVYEEMKRSNLVAPPRIQTLINPEYQFI